MILEVVIIRGNWMKDTNELYFYNIFYKSESILNKKCALFCLLKVLYVAISLLVRMQSCSPNLVLLNCLCI